jgi:hypothetical protein
MRGFMIGKRNRFFQLCEPLFQKFLSGIAGVAPISSTSGK